MKQFAYVKNIPKLSVCSVKQLMLKMLSYESLRRVRGSSMRGTAFHQANATVAALTNEMDRIRSDLVDSINSLSFAHDPPVAVEASPAPTRIQDHQANATSNNFNQEFLSTLQALQLQIQNLNSSNGGGNRNRNGGGNNGRSTSRRRRNVSKYCWTNGACSHTSSECNNKAPGHKNEAIFENKLGGSTNYCTENTNN